MKNFLENFSIFVNHFDSLKETSKDTSKIQTGGEIEYITKADIQVINFDDVKTEYVNTFGLSNEVACSVDALAIINGYLAFIEFKNGKIEKNNLRFKIKDSLMIFCDIVEKSIAFTRKKVDLYVIYNTDAGTLSKEEQKDNMRKCNIQESPARDALWKNLELNSKEEIVRFGLKRFKWLYFHDVHTYTKEKFSQIIKTLQPIQKGI